jgi:DNA-binding CsgD family transcriptional regulator
MLGIPAQYASPVPVGTELRNRIERLGRAGLTAKALRLEVIAAVRRAIPFDGYVFPLTDPTTRVAISPLADVPGLEWPRLPELIRWRYLTTVNRWDVLLDAATPAAALRQATGDHPERSLLWRYVQRELGVVDTAAVPLGDRYGCWAVLDLWRTSTPFTPAEVELLGALQGALTVAVRTAVAGMFADARDAAPTPGSAIVLLGDDLQVKDRTDAAAAALLKLNPPDEPMAPVPAAAYNIGAALVADEAGVPIGEPWARVYVGGNQWLTVRAARLGNAEIAISIEPAGPAERMDLYARATTFSPRETEVLELLATGLDSRAIATRLVVSEHTVNDHVKAMLGKAGVRSRHQLIARALGGG